MYRYLLKPLLFLLDPESAHRITFALLKIIFLIPGKAAVFRAFFRVKDKRLEKEILGLKFENPVGLAAGFDKDARHIDLLDPFGFGFIEIGTLTPKPQPGNDKPRLFRLPADKALINRMGFNNLGVEEAVKQLRNRKSRIIIGGNIGKNKITPNDEAFRDYETALNALYDHVDYFVVNLSSPNTPGLRELQEKEPLKQLLLHLLEIIGKKTVKKPLLLKIAPDLTQEQLNDIVDIATELKLDGIVATNTTISRADLQTPDDRLEKIGNGGLSGLPLEDRATEVIRFIRSEMGEKFPIIGVGGIMSPEDALRKLQAGADLVQVYTGFIYNGPGFVRKINRAILKQFKQIN